MAKNTPNLMKNVQETQQIPMEEIQKIPSLDIIVQLLRDAERDLESSKREATPYGQMILKKPKRLLIWNYTGAGQNTEEWHNQSA